MSKVYKCQPREPNEKIYGSILVNKEYLEEISNELLEAAVLIREWGAYASTYFKEKHDLAGDIKAVEKYATDLKELLK